jgi:hypothetical protein
MEVSLELLGAQQGIQQVRTQSPCDQQRYDVFHKLLLETVAALHERPAGGEEQNRKQNEERV